ncbi:prepilin cleavage protein [Vitiosangium sp. GDMCC 1.1324]|uniref:type IV pilus modification PilV family protein n=1 Tax=Vitiosangium sp. (strain GDMCC 1.1324) TaxID=2138576 RepID=UPI0011B6082D|nr:prepilin cleavage protein [Vitiosangium sp. GDMCC 1.1324]
MDFSSRRRIRRMGAAPRGVSLIEGMVASVVLLIGLMGVFQGIMVASRQNSMANQASRASGIASQVRVALDSLGRDRVLGSSGGAAGMLTGAACNPGNDVKALAGGLETLTPGSGEPWTVRCIFDLDAFETGAQSANKLLPGYSDEDSKRFRRVLVWVTRLDEVSNVPIDEVAVVVSWNELGRRRFFRQYVGFYDSSPFGNATNVQI